jgi:hypothetical protein
VNNTVYAAVDTASVPSWMRAMTATRLAQDGKQWTELFGEFNSGTYNNQWSAARVPERPGLACVWCRMQQQLLLHELCVTADLVCRISASSAHPLMYVMLHRMIVDYKLFTSGSTIKPDTLWITEQMPGAMYSKDVSQILNDQGYWSRSDKNSMCTIATRSRHHFG